MYGYIYEIVTAKKLTKLIKLIKCLASFFFYTETYEDSPCRLPLGCPLDKLMNLKLKLLRVCQFSVNSSHLNR